MPLFVPPLPSSVDNQALTATAFHEAAHAVVLLHFGQPVMRVSIEPDEAEGNLGRVTHRGPGFFEVGARHRRQIAREQILSCYAGLHGERLYDPEAWESGAENDHADAYRMSADYGVFPRYFSYVGDDAHHEYLERLNKEARRLVRTLSVPIYELALVLLEKGVLTGVEARQAVEPHLPHWPTA